MVVRKATPDDAMSVLQLYRFGAIPGATGCLVFEEGHFRQFAEAPQARLFVAEEGGRIVGFVLGYDLVVWAYIDMLVVSEDWRGKGVGSSLRKAFEASGEGRWRTVEMCHLADEHQLKEFADRSGFSVNGPEGGWTWRYRFMDGRGGG